MLPAALMLCHPSAVKDETSVKTAKSASVTTEICHGFVLLCTPEGEGDTHRLYVSMTLALQRLLHNLKVGLQGCAGQGPGACVTRCCCRASAAGRASPLVLPGSGLDCILYCSCRHTKLQCSVSCISCAAVGASLLQLIA